MRPTGLNNWGGRWEGWGNVEKRLGWFSPVR